MGLQAFEPSLSLFRFTGSIRVNAATRCFKFFVQWKWHVANARPQPVYDLGKFAQLAKLWRDLARV